MPFEPKVVDTSHYEVIKSWQAAKDAGLIGMITKVTQGTHYADPKHHEFIQDALAVGLKVGGYHFNTGEDPIEQADWFLHNCDDENVNDFLYALDYEANPRSDMNIHQAVAFLHHIEESLGRKAVIYSGNKLKEDIGDLNENDKAYVCSHKLWLAQYSTKYKLPSGFDRFFLWQYTGDGMGPGPHWIDGIKCPGNNGLDLNVYDGSDDQLRAEWAT